MARTEKIALRRGSMLGKYRLEARVGSGSFAEVWRAADTVERRKVALKVAHPELVAEWGREELEREARIATRLKHPNVVAVRNADWIEGRFVMATDLATSHLDDYSKAWRSGAVALEVIRDVARGLAHAHGQRIMHRDVKPENILILDDGHAALCDFGVSRFAKSATATYTEAGTLGFIAPEQAYGRPTMSSDVFSLGLIAYELLTGVRPTWPFDWPPREGYPRFQAKVPEPVQNVLRKAMEFQPRKRYPDAVAFDQALEAAFRKVDKDAAPAPRRRKRPRKAPSVLEVHAGLFKRHHGRALGMRYACRQCSGPISEAMRHCPWCGAGEQSFLDVTTYPLVCPDCERGVRAEWNYCPWCYTGRFRSNGRRPRRDPKAVRQCAGRGCEGQLQPFMSYCPMCKRKPGRPWSHAELPDRCGRCRWPVSKRYWRFCPWCARRQPEVASYSRRG